MTLIDPATAKWLVSEYGVSQSATNGMTVSRIQKHALVTEPVTVEGRYPATHTSGMLEPANLWLRLLPNPPTKDRGPNSRSPWSARPGDQLTVSST